MMRKFLCFVLFSVSALYAYGQQIYFETGTSVSKFDYKNSDGESLANMFGSNHFFMQAGYHTISPVERLNYSAGLSYNTYGSQSSDSTLGNYFEWNVNYIGVDLGIDYEIYKRRFIHNSLSDLSVYIKATITPEFLLHGTQTINNRVYNLNGIEQFKYPFLFARGGIGVSYALSSLITVYAEYMGGKGFPLKFGDSADKEKLRITNHNIGFGLYVNLPTYR
jgi:hypothetical protein